MKSQFPTETVTLLCYFFIIQISDCCHKSVKKKNFLKFNTKLTIVLTELDFSRVVILETHFSDGELFSN